MPAGLRAGWGFMVSLPRHPLLTFFLLLVRPYRSISDWCLFPRGGRGGERRRISRCPRSLRPNEESGGQPDLSRPISVLFIPLALALSFFLSSTVGGQKGADGKGEQKGKESPPAAGAALPPPRRSRVRTPVDCRGKKSNA